MNGKVARPLRLSAILALIIACLWALDWFLERTQVRELQAEARRVYVDGSRLLKEGKLPQAVDLLSRAHAVDRKNVNYELTLIDALIAAGKTAEAEPLLDEILQRESNDGAANLTAARLMASKGRMGDAESYYHRAIYGEWPNNPDRSRRSVRMELIEFLLKNERKQGLLAELLPLQEAAEGDLALKKRIAHLFLVAGSPTRAADAYRSLIQQDRKDADLYSGLGEAQLVAGQYRPAVAAFVAAFRRRPDEPNLRQRMEFSSLMSGLDPTARQLSSMEKYRRSLHILDLTRASYQKCTGKSQTADQVPPPNKPPPHVNNEVAEQKLALAEQIWRARINECGASTSKEEEPLRLIMAKLAQ
ncbi:MAG: tetratricopeptide repeat protein [Bryobacteraceae bacterium]